MGIDWHTVKFLADARKSGTELGAVATMGRLDVFVSGSKIQEILRDAGVVSAFGEGGVPEDRYAEPLLRKLGATSVDSVDASSYEGATIIHDLNVPIPDHLTERFDTVLDGGTIEHVFDVKLAFQNQMSMVKKGGSLIIATMANNWLGHGFYQFSPELFHRVLSPENGFRIVRVILHEHYEFAPWYEVPDPTTVQQRIELSNSWRGVDVIVHAVREEIVPIFQRTPQQSDYAATWDVATEQPVVQHQAVGLRRRLIDRAKSALPGLLASKHKLLTRYPSIARFSGSRRATRYHKGHSFSAQPHKFKRSRS